MIASFARQKVVRLRGTKMTDRYDNEVIDWTAPAKKTIESVTVVPIGGSETFDVAGGRRVTRWQLNTDMGADILPDDRIEYAGDTYDIDGGVPEHPSPSGRLDHLEVMLKRVESHG